MNPLQRTLIEKAGHDNGFEYVLPGDAQHVALASARHPARVCVALAGQGFEAHITTGSATLAQELARTFAASQAGVATFVLPSEALLAHWLRRAAALSQALPNQAVAAFEQQVQAELAELASEGESFLAAPERRVKTPWVEAQSAAIAGAMASICNDETGCFGVQGGHGQKTLSLSVAAQNTEVLRMVRQRVGQQAYRQAMLDYWGGACAVTGLALAPVLRASHAKPWAVCESDAERLDVFNGLLLAAHLDALFDQFLLSFDAQGQLLVAPQLDAAAREVLGLHPALRMRWVAPEHQRYLGHHRQRFFAGP